MALKFSIVIPSYNQGEWLDACLKSVLDQEGVSVEVIVMDGGSRDASVSIIEGHADRLAYWQSRPDGGQAAAIQAGFERAEGDILGWLNSDDILLPGALAEVEAFFRSHPQEEVVTGGAYFIDGAGAPYRWRRFNQNHTLGVAAEHERFRYFHPQQGIWQPATFWRQSAYQAVGGVDPQFHYIMDFDLLTRLSARRPLARLPAWLACFRIHADNKTHAQRHVYHREMALWAAKYGLDREAPWRKGLKFSRYLPPFILEKVRSLWRERGPFPPELP